LPSPSRGRQGHPLLGDPVREGGKATPGWRRGGRLAAPLVGCFPRGLSDELVGEPVAGRRASCAVALASAPGLLACLHHGAWPGRCHPEKYAVWYGDRPLANLPALGSALHYQR
jgi:hypothetical protein